MSAHSLFKLDGLIIKDEARSFYFMVNFNVPLKYLEDESVALEKFKVIKECVVDEFEHEIEQEALSYSIAANYDLVHKNNSETREWEGSFQDRTNQDFYIVDNLNVVPDSFVSQAVEYARIDNVVRRLTWAGLNSDWTFSKLNSVIFVFQARCHYSKHKFRSNSLILPNNRYKELEQNRKFSFSKRLEF